MKKGQRRMKTEEAISAEVERLVPRPASVIELSCGRGHLLGKLREKGYDVVGTNYSVYEDAAPDLPILSGVDVTQGAGFTERTFDCVIFSEAIQNISDHYAVFRTVADLLKEGGIAVITTPNILNVRSRLHFLLTGFFRVKWNFIGFDVPYEESFCYHNHPLHLPVDAYYALKAGLTLGAVDGINVKYRNLLPLALLYAPIWLATWWNTSRAEPYLARSGYGDAVCSWMTGFQTLAAERLMLVMRKETPEVQARRTPRISWYRKAERPACETS